MGFLRTAVTLVARNVHNRPNRLCAASSQTMLIFQRDAHIIELNKNMQYISQDKLQLRADPTTKKLDKPIDKPLCILLTWLLARRKHIMKYADIYLEQGFDVLCVTCTPWQLMWPTKGSQLVAADLLRFMTTNQRFPSFTVHSFSVGAYLWGELSVHALKNKPLYQPVLDRVAAQVCDSTTDISELTIGVPAAVFPNNKILQKGLQAYLTTHLRLFNDAATVHYKRASQVFYRHPITAPALFLLSKSDPIAAEHVVRKAADTWETLGVKVTWKCWDRSPHVQHLTKHPKEYLEALHTHLEAAGLVSQPVKTRL